MRVEPGANLPRAVARADRGDRICLSAGTYRLTRPIRPRAGQTIVGSKAVLDGSRILRGFVKQPDGWAVRGQRQQGERNGECLKGKACTYPDDVVRDGKPLRRVLKRSQLGPGRYWFDYKRNTIHVGDDPRGHRLRALVSSGAIVSRNGAAGANVTVSGLTVQRFATRAQHGAIETTAPGWTIRGTTVRDNHGAGITTQGHARIVRNRVLRNGQLGIGGTGDHTLVSHNVIAGNGRGGFDPAWEAGGAKWAVTDHLTVVGNRVTRNTGPGLWTDIDAQHTTYSRNVVRDNTWMGIFHEISADAIISGNTVTGNGHGFDAWLWGSGILVAASHDVRISSNRLADNAQGIGLIQQDRGISDVDGRPRVLHNLAITGNRVAMARGDSGMVQSDGNGFVFDDPTITWSGNVWTQRDRDPFAWNDTNLTLAQWRALGHDN
ncbi:right-handed parallel beta-helix repeat-containing protein [Solicola sp. PLA-1-18]|uniref:right-handed parallel beta-helix repeat-containing protein n=1 Tax=Solicola sp. PLA-1-18 TaxID=3380532 RepID=UPI003B801CAE